MCAHSKQVIPGILRKANRLESGNEALWEDIQKWQNKAEKMEVQDRKVKEKLGSKSRKNLFIVFVVAVWVIVTVLIWIWEPTNGHYFGKLQFDGY